MTGPVFDSGLELRAAGDGTRRLKGRFPYGKRAVLDAGGKGRRPKKEEFAPKSLAFAVEDPDRDVHLLLGHSFDKPLASKKARTLILLDSDDALSFEAILTPEIQEASWVKDFIAGFLAGLITGISPGFRIAPPEVVENPEEVTEEDPSEGNALIRTIFAAILFELSIVTRPAYHETELDMRSWETHQDRLPVRGLIRQVISLTLSAEGGDAVDLPIGPLAPDAHVTVNGIETADGIEGGRWPSITLPANLTGTVMLTYEAGYGDTPASIPADLRLAVMDQASMLYDARGPTDVRQGLSVAAARICARHRRVRL